MKIECVIVCKDYADFLRYTLPENMEQLDRIVVVTHPNDKHTINLCRRYSVTCVKTTAMHMDGDCFNKGRAINIGLGHLRGLDWILHIDADILLPHSFKDMLRRAQLERENLYGADRCNIRGYDHFQKWKHLLEPHFSEGYFVEPPPPFPVGARIIHEEHGYVPIGYFQLWHKSMARKYPIHQGNAEHTDVLFGIQWPRENRILLPEVIVYHLESEHCEMGKNWNGRKTKHFGPPWDDCKCHPYQPYKPYCPKEK